MAKIFAPNKAYTGVTATVPFANGVGETDDERLLRWFEEHGYSVETPKPEDKAFQPSSFPPAENINEDTGGGAGQFAQTPPADNVNDVDDAAGNKSKKGKAAGGEQK